MFIWCWWILNNGTNIPSDNSASTCFAIQLINSLWPHDAVYQHESRSILAQVMACCLMAPSHYLNQCWLIISTIHWQSSEGHFTRDTPAINHFRLKITDLKFQSNLPVVNEWNESVRIWVLQFSLHSFAFQLNHEHGQNTILFLSMLNHSFFLYRPSSNALIHQVLCQSWANVNKHRQWCWCP